MRKPGRLSIVSGQDKNSQIVIYQTKDGQTKLDVRLEDETVWLSQDQMAELYVKSKSTINEHVKNVYEEHELAEEATLRKFGNSEFSTKPTNFYNLDMIISSEKELLTHSGNVTADAAAQKAEAEFDKYRAQRSKNMISDFDLAVKELEKKGTE
jgi:hypothetical protein